MKQKKLTLEEVKHIAKLANLELPDSKLEDYREKLAETLDYVSDLQKIETKTVRPTPQVIPTENRFREDVITPSLTVQEALANAKRQYNGFFVTQIIWS